MQEDNHTEFKREYTADIKKEVVAFANSNGGVIYIGRNDEGISFPLTDVDQTLTQLTNSIRDSILPDVTMFVNYEIGEGEIKIIVQEGTNKPYYLKEKGLKPSGVYVRQGSSCVPASHEQIRSLIKLTDGDKFEATRSIDQELTFDAAVEEFANKDMAFGESQMQTLGMISSDGLYTNLGLILSDQCDHSIKFAVFNGTKKGQFKTRKEMGGSIFKQMRSAFDFLQLSNNLAATFSGLDRIEQYDYPEEAIREAMLNALIHRDYSLSGSIIVNLYDDRIEFVSIGGLMPGLQTEDLFLGVSQPRNEKLANIFYRLKHIEAYGTGLQRIMQHYEEFNVKPTIEATPGAFRLTLPNMNYVKPINYESLRSNVGGFNTVNEPRTTIYDVSAEIKRKPKHQHQVILNYLQENNFITNELVQKILSVKQTRAYTVIREMVNQGLIVKSSPDPKDNKYVLVLPSN